MFDVNGLVLMPGRDVLRFLQRRLGLLGKLGQIHIPSSNTTLTHFRAKAMPGSSLLSAEHETSKSEDRIPRPEIIPNPEARMPNVVVLIGCGSTMSIWISDFGLDLFRIPGDSDFGFAFDP